jgi:hypothetical protein
MWDTGKRYENLCVIDIKCNYLEIIESQVRRLIELCGIRTMGIASVIRALICRGNSGFEDNFKQLTSFSEEFLRKVLGAKI